jgi:hypothetical protein
MRRLLLGGALLALLATPAMAQVVRVRVNAPPAPVVNVQPRWQWDAQSRVYYVNDPNLDYDAFRYGQYYYIYNDGYWYRSNAWNGDFEAVQPGSVPRAIYGMSDYQWRNARPTWSAYNGDNDDDNDNRYGNWNNTTGNWRNTVVVRNEPRWEWMPDQQVYVAVNPDRDYDMFRSGSTVYVFDNGNWYRSNAWNGRYMMVSRASVPRAVMTEWQSNDWRDRDWRDRDWRDRDDNDWRYRNDSRYGNRSDNGYRYSTIQVRTRPRWRWMPNQRVYVAVNPDRDYEMYRMGNWYYVVDQNGNWYRSQNWNGRYYVVQQRYVPQVLFTVSSSRGQWYHRNRRY